MSLSSCRHGRKSDIYKPVRIWNYRVRLCICITNVFCDNRYYTTLKYVTRQIIIKEERYVFILLNINQKYHHHQSRLIVQTYLYPPLSLSLSLSLSSSVPIIHSSWLVHQTASSIDTEWMSVSFVALPTLEQPCAAIPR